MTLQTFLLPARPSTQAWGPPEFHTGPHVGESDLDGNSNEEETHPLRSDTRRFDAPLTTCGRDALRERQRLQASSAIAEPRAPTTESLMQVSQQHQETLKFQFAMAYLDRMAQLVQNAQAIVNGPFLPMPVPMSLTSAPWTSPGAPVPAPWTTWSPYVSGSPGPTWVDGTPYFSPYCSPFDPMNTWSPGGALGAGMLGAGMLGAGAMCAGLLSSGLVANTLGHAVGSTFGGALCGLFSGFGW